MTQLQSKMRHYAGRKYGRALTRNEWAIIQVACEFKNSALRAMSRTRMEEIVRRYA